MRPSPRFVARLAAGVALAAALAWAVHASQRQRLVVSGSEVSIDQAHGLRMYQAQPFTGTVVARHPNGKLAAADDFVNGRRDGHARLWFPDGTLGYEARFKAGIRDGVSSSWWANGRVRSHTIFVADKEQGEAWEWYVTGEKFKRYQFKDGQPDGLQRAWRTNGKLFSNFEIRDGRMYGLNNAKPCFGVRE